MVSYGNQPRALTSGDLLRPLTGPVQRNTHFGGRALTSGDLLKPLTGPGRVDTNYVGRPLIDSGRLAAAKTPSSTSSAKTKTQNASLLSSNNLLKKETERIKGVLSDVHKSLIQAQKGFAVVQKNLVDTKKELSQAKTANEELAQALESKLTAARSKPVKTPKIGCFNSKEVRPDTVPVERTSKQISFNEAYQTFPSIAIGLYSINVPSGASMRASCSISGLDNKSFEVNIDGDNETGLNSGGCTWLEIEPDHEDFQCGSFNTMGDRPWNTPQASNQCRISFQRPYIEPPQVIVWLTAFDMNPEKNWRVKTYASDITAAGFTIHIDTWGDTQLYYAGASWIAYSSGKPDVCHGSFSTLDVRPYTDPQSKNSGPVEFPNNAFTTTPSIALGINAIDVDCAKGMTLEVTGTHASPSGVTWCLNSWMDTILYSAAGTYIAFA